MSDEPEPINKTADSIIVPDGEWSMPEPVFRTSEGNTPKSPVAVFEGDEYETEAANTDEPAEPSSDISDEIAIAITDEMPVYKPKSRGCAKNFLFIIGLIGVIAAALIILAVYFLFYFRPAETGSF
ncbi:MAG: hypothetical protein ABIP78_11645 [Pyrinomonadaceae bacterium]